MTADDAAAAFIAGRVPVAVTWEPNLTLVKTKKVGKVLIDSSATPGVIVDVLALSCKTIKEKAERREGRHQGALSRRRLHEDQSREGR